MTEFLRLLESELKKEYPSYGIEISFMEDYIPGRLPAVVISPGVKDRRMATLSERSTSVSFSITVIEQHVPELTMQEVEMCENIISYIENNIEIMRAVISINSSLSTSIEKLEDDLNGTFFGKIKINTQLRRRK